MNKTVILALVLLVGSIMAGSYGLAQTGDAAATEVSAQKATAVSAASITSPANAGFGWVGTINAGKDSTYKIAFSTATITPSSSNGISEAMVVGVANLYQGDQKVLYKLVENKAVTEAGVKSYLVLPIDASFGNFAEAKSKGIGFLTLKTLTTINNRGKILFYLNKGDSSQVGKIYVGDVSQNSGETTVPVVTSPGYQVAAKNVQTQPVNSVNSANAKSTLVQRILSILRLR